MHKDKFSKQVVSNDFLFLAETSSQRVDDFLKKKDFLVKKNSSIQGTGIFTTLFIPAEEVFYLVPQNDLRSAPIPRGARIASNKFVYDESVLNYINHSCDANSEMIIEQQRIVLKAKRDICAGEEITLDYTATEEKNTLVPCNCGSKKCRNYFFYT